MKPLLDLGAETNLAAATAQRPSMLALLLMPLLALLTACETTPIMPIAQPTFNLVQPAEAATTRLATGSIYSGRQSENLFGRGRSFQVGDVITVLLDESMQANRTMNTTVSRDSSNQVVPTALNVLGGFRGAPLTTNLQANKTLSDGQGLAKQNATLIGSIAVSVVEILANGNLVVRGEKQLSLSEGSELIQVSGVIRPEDVAPNNFVQSRRLAHSQIAYRGSGDLTDGVKPGWGTKILGKYWPF